MKNTVKRIELLIPTVNKTKEQLFELCDIMNVNSDVLISNQCGIDEFFSFKYKEHQVKVINNSTIGISKNRNILLNNSSADIVLFMDDDGIMDCKYPETVLSFFESHNCDVVKFNFQLFYSSGNRKNILVKRTKKAHFFDVSPYGMPGIAFVRRPIIEKKLSFNEKVGVPNYIFNGEDSLFIKSIFKSGLRTYVSSDYIGKIDDTESSWFNSFNKQFFVSKGYLYYALYGIFYFLFIIRMFIIFHKQIQYSLCKVIAFAKIGRKMYKDDTSK